MRHVAPAVSRAWRVCVPAGLAAAPLGGAGPMPGGLGWPGAPRMPSKIPALTSHSAVRASVIALCLVSSPLVRSAEAVQSLCALSCLAFTGLLLVDSDYGLSRHVAGWFGEFGAAERAEGHADFAVVTGVEIPAVGLPVETVLEVDLLGAFRATVCGGNGGHGRDSSQDDSQPNVGPVGE